MMKYKKKQAKERKAGSSLFLRTYYVELVLHTTNP